MSSRLQNLLDELEANLARARQHEATMRAGLAESAVWSRSDDREWIQQSAMSATCMRAEAELRLAQARRIVDRARNGGHPTREETRACVECGQPIQPRQIYVIDGPKHIACSSPAGSAR